MNTTRLSHGWLALKLLAALALFAGASLPVFAADVLASRNDDARTGANLQETVLSTANVNSQRFGRLWNLYADGQVVAQPLHVSRLAVDTTTNPQLPPVRGTFNAVVIATMHNTVYVYDAERENPGPEGRTVPLWARWLGQPRPGGKEIDMWSTNDPEWGILSTPVIDQAKTTLYVVAWHDDGGNQNYKYRLHALSLKDGSHIRPPVEITATGAGGGVRLDTVSQKQRPGLALSGGVLYIGFGGDGNKGLLMAYDASTLAQRAVWVVTPTGNGAGLWQSGQAPAVDANGRVYLMTGNGTFDAHTGGGNYGDSLVKLALQNDRLVVEDYFTPCNQSWLDSIDHDLGVSGPVLIPNTTVVAGVGKQGRLYLVSRTNMGKHLPSATPRAQACANTNVVQEFQATQSEIMSHVHSAPVFWRGPDASRIYLWGEHDRLRAYVFANGRFQANAPRLGSIAPADGMPGGMLSLSSNGQRAGTGIVWAVTPRDGDANTQRGVQGQVVAMDAQDVSRTLWTSEQVAARDRLGLFAKFTPPTVAGGKVFVATYGDQEPRQTYAGGGRPQQFPGRYYVAVYGPLDEKPFDVINQDRADITVLRAATEGPLTIDIASCLRLDDGTADCTAELERAQGAPSLHRVVVPQGHTFPGCRLLRVTTASKTIAARNAANLGFYSADATGGQLSASRGWTIAKTKLKEVGFATLRAGESATLHEFVGIVGCQIDAAMAQSKIFKPFMDFRVEQNRLIYSNWDVSANYTISTAAPNIDRSAEVIRP